MNCMNFKKSFSQRREIYLKNLILLFNCKYIPYEKNNILKSYFLLRCSFRTK